MYVVASVATRCVLVAGAFRGLHRLPQAGIARYERRLTGVVRVGVGITSFFMEW